jgi:hypothetical protein
MSNFAGRLANQNSFWALLKTRAFGGLYFQTSFFPLAPNVFSTAQTEVVVEIPRGGGAPIQRQCFLTLQYVGGGEWQVEGMKFGPSIS